MSEENKPVEVVEDDPEKIDSKFKLGAYAIKNWWKILLMIIVIGLLITGGSMSYSKEDGFSCSKSQIKYDKSSIPQEVLPK